MTTNKKQTAQLNNQQQMVHPIRMRPPHPSPQESSVLAVSRSTTTPTTASTTASTTRATNSTGRMTGTAAVQHDHQEENAAKGEQREKSVEVSEDQVVSGNSIKNKKRRKKNKNNTTIEPTTQHKHLHNQEKASPQQPAEEGSRGVRLSSFTRIKSAPPSISSSSSSSYYFDLMVPFPKSKIGGREGGGLLIQAQSLLHRFESIQSYNTIAFTDIIQGVDIISKNQLNNASDEQHVLHSSSSFVLKLQQQQQVQSKLQMIQRLHVILENISDLSPFIKNNNTLGTTTTLASSAGFTSQHHHHHQQPKGGKNKKATITNGQISSSRSSATSSNSSSASTYWDKYELISWAPQNESVFQAACRTTTTKIADASSTRATTRNINSTNTTRTAAKKKKRKLVSLQQQQDGVVRSSSPAVEIITLDYYTNGRSQLPYPIRSIDLQIATENGYTFEIHYAPAIINRKFRKGFIQTCYELQNAAYHVHSSNNIRIVFSSGPRTILATTHTDNSYNSQGKTKIASRYNNDDNGNDDAGALALRMPGDLINLMITVLRFNTKTAHESLTKSAMYALEQGYRRRWGGINRMNHTILQNIHVQEGEGREEDVTNSVVDNDSSITNSISLHLKSQPVSIKTDDKDDNLDDDNEQDYDPNQDFLSLS